MIFRLPFPAPGTLVGRSVRRLLPDLAVLVGVIAIVAALAALSAGITAPFGPGQLPSVSTDPANLPYYAGRSLLRMFTALGVSTVFALTYGYAAAKSRRAERVLIPLLDILQSVPVLGFLSVTVSGFIALFPGSLLGLEAAAIFAIFTSQAWNMAFAVYHSMRTVPRDLTEAARVYQLSRWQRLRRLELPVTINGLIWNGMMSMGGAWFFLTASELISVNNQTYQLPGIGSYVGVAIGEGNLTAVCLAIVLMIVIVVAVDRLFWRPLVAWSERFKIEESEASERVQSLVLDLVRRSRLVAAATRAIGAALLLIGTQARRLSSDRSPTLTSPTEPAAQNVRHRPGRLATLLASDSLFNLVLVVVLGLGAIALVNYVASEVSPGDVAQAFGLGLLTFGRVVAVVVISALLWTPVGVWIGMNPRVSRIAQPIVQVAASFPANFLFPFVTIFMLGTGLPIGLGAIPLMALGAQWYILFNTVAGAIAIPNDLREASATFGLSRRLRWRALIGPAIFPAWVTGAITAAGGAWNASIVAEVVTWGQDTLRANGLGSYIADATSVGDFPKTFLGIAVMALFVVGLNRLFWRRLYDLAESRYRIA